MPRALRIGALPSWVPAPGNIAVISLNTLQSVDPCPGFATGSPCPHSGQEGIAGVLDDWTGAAYARAYSALGAVLFHGGGHNGYYGNEVYAFDLSTRLFALCGSNYPTQSFDYDADEGEIQPGIPASSHTYDHIGYLPPELAGNTHGKFLRLVSASNHESAGGGSGRSHAFDLTSNTWSRYSANKCGVQQGAAECWSAYDTSRQCFWIQGQGTQGLWRLDDLAGSPTWSQANALGGLALNESTMAYSPTKDCLAIYRNDSVRIVKCGTLASGAPEVTVTGTPPGITQAAAIEWEPLLGCFVIWGSGKTVYKLTPPSGDIHSQSWAWSSETLSGPTPTTPVNGPYSKLIRADSIRSFVYCGDKDEPVYAFRLTGT